MFWCYVFAGPSLKSYVKKFSFKVKVRENHRIHQTEFLIVLKLKFLFTRPVMQLIDLPPKFYHDH